MPRKGVTLIIDGGRIYARTLAGRGAYVKREQCAGLFEHLQRITVDGITGAERAMRLQGELQGEDEEFGELLQRLAEEE